MQHVSNVIESRTKLISSAATNGYLLTPERLHNLVKLGVTDYQITFDGDSDHHNLLRRKVDGSGSFDLIWSNILQSHNSDLPFEILIRIHANKDNLESIRKLLKKTKACLEGDKRFKIWIYPLTRLGGRNDYMLPFIKGHKDSVEIASLKREVKELGLELFEQNTEPENICPSAKLNSFVIRSDGRIGKCAIILEDEKNTVGRLLNDGTLEIDNSKLAWWGRGLLSGNVAELYCPLRG